MRTLLTAALAAAVLLPAAPALAQRHDQRDDRPPQDQRHDRRNDQGGDPRNYDYNRQPPGGYHADQYYRAGDARGERRMTRNDRIYRGRDNRYYCRRSDGSTGLVVGAVAGGVLGNTIAGNGSRLLGTLLGGAGGALLGQSVDRGQVRCR